MPSLISLASTSLCMTSKRDDISHTSCVVFLAICIRTSCGSFDITTGIKRLPYWLELTPRASNPLTLMLILS